MALTLGSTDVHVWRVSLAVAPPVLVALADTLAPDERARAARFLVEHARREYIAGRGFLRAILGRYLGRPPEAITFIYSAYGKPDLAPGQGPVRFNLAHAGAWALYAVTRDREVGIDIEAIRPLPELESIATHYFAAPEVTALRAVPPARRATAFFTGWVRKEAYIKAHGEGLSLPLDQFAVTLTPGEPARLLPSPGDPVEATRWQLHDLPAPSGYLAALAVEGSVGQLLVRVWPDEAMRDE
jgi:4'-phosphopantetheinyl transferase